MDAREREQLILRYSRFSDEELREMLRQGRQDYEPEAYRLLEQEAARRELNTDEPKTQAPREDESESAGNRGREPVTAYVQVMVINDVQDRRHAQALLEGAGIVFIIEQMSLSGGELPVALLAEENRVKEAMRVLEGFCPRASIKLW